MADATNPERKSRLKARLLQLVTAGAGSIVVATTVMPAPAAGLAKPSSDPVMVRAARAKVVAGAPGGDHGQAPALEFAWWRNWGNGGWHPGWRNGPNWRNWHNWRNW